MPQRPPHTQAKIARAIKGAVKGGLIVRGVEITIDGTLRLLADNSKQSVIEAQANALDNWRERKENGPR